MRKVRHRKVRYLGQNQPVLASVELEPRSLALGPVL